MREATLEARRSAPQRGDMRYVCCAQHARRIYATVLRAAAQPLGPRFERCACAARSVILRDHYITQPVRENMSDRCLIFITITARVCYAPTRFMLAFILRYAATSALRYAASQRCGATRIRFMF